MYKFNFSSINLGCNKNLVDTQYLLGRILSFGWLSKDYKINYMTDPYDKNVKYVFLNTCGFLSTWRDEMISEIEKLIDKNKNVIVLGCWAKYFKTLDSKSKPDILKDSRISFLSWQDLDKITILDLLKWYSSKKFEDFDFVDNVRAYTNSIYKFEYIKVAEWCNNNCSFCIIPKIRWKQKSLSIEKILEESENMIKSWIEEIIILSQDTTRYGMDLYAKPMMFELLEKLDKLSYDFSYRILYLYPDIVTLKQLEKFKKLKKFIPYFDIPLQHISSNVLKNMWRFYDSKYIYKFLDFIQDNFPIRFIRTNIIVGFPWETDKDFKELINFVKKVDFDNISIFEYHDEKLADSSKLPDKISDDVVHKRFLELKKIVDNKMKEKQKSKKWKIQYWYVMDILEDKKIENSKFIVRPYLNAPEIDVYDTIKFSKIKWVYNQSGNIDIGTKIEYVI
jgi:ribosomal protein S12 methylthiotransferase